MDARTRFRLRQARWRALTPSAHRAIPGWRPLAITAVLVVLMGGAWRYSMELPPGRLTAAALSREIETTAPRPRIELPGIDEQNAFLADVEFYAWLGGLPSPEQTTR